MNWPVDPSEDPPSPLLETWSQAGSGLLRFDARAMGTTNALLLPEGVLDDPLDGSEEEQLADLARRVFAIQLELEARLSKFRPESELSILNRLGSERPIGLGEDLWALLEYCQAAWRLSDGAFDPTIGPLVRAWGLVDGVGRRPEPQELEGLLARCGMDGIELDASSRTARLKTPGLSLDLGAVGKGWAADRMSEALADAGLPCSVVIGGRSTILVRGAPPCGEGWDVEVVHPREPESILATLRMQPGALSTSGAYEREVRIGRERIGHILDPRTGRPVRGIDSATVWTRDAALGDVLSTALFVLGEAALEPNGAVEGLLRALDSGAGAPRASILMAVDDPGEWGGLRITTRHLGPEPGFERIDGA